MRTATLSLLATVLLCFQAAAPPRTAEIDRPLPAFRLNDQAGSIQRIGGKSELWTVVAFYPKALTPG